MFALRLFITLSLTALLLSARAQDIRQYSFTHFGAAEGLISNEGRAVLHDDKGFVWIGTGNGLQRYDGARFITFRHDRNDPKSIPNNLVLQLIKGPDNKIWVLCSNNQVAVLDPDRLEFTQIPTKFTSKNAALATTKLIRDPKGNMFLLAGLVELLTWTPESGEFNKANNPFSIPPGRLCIDIAAQPGTEKYWISSNRGLSIYNAATGQHSYAGHNVEKEPVLELFDTTHHAFNIFFDRNDRVWFDIWGPGYPLVNCYDLSANKVVLRNFHFINLLKTYYETHGYMQQADGTIWIRGLGVLARFLENENRFQLVYNGFVNEQSIVYEGVSSFCEDNGGSIWLTTTNNGLYRFAPSEQYFTNISHLHPVSGLPGKGSILSFLRLPGGDLLAASWGDGLYRYDKQLKNTPLNFRGINEKNPITVWDMLIDRDSTRIWMGMQPGIGEYNLRSKTFRTHFPPQFNNNTIRQIEADRRGNLWIGTMNSGLFKWDVAKGSAGKFEDGLKKVEGVVPGSITKIFVDSKGLVWVAALGTGVYVFDPIGDELLLHLPATNENGDYNSIAQVGHIMEYDDTSMVFSGGPFIHIYNRITKQIRTVGNENTISGRIASVEKDPRGGYLWVSSSQGLYRVNIYNKIFVHFDRIDGIADDRFVLSASLRLPDGRLLFGAENQFTIFQPADVRINNTIPKITITGVRVMNRQLLVDSLLQQPRLELGPKENSITINFSGLSYNGAFMIRYKLEGLDEDWQIADKSNEAVYSYLPAGEYTFMARSEDADGKASPHTTKLLIKIYPHFYQTWWFYGLLLLLGAVVLYWIDRERIRRLNELERVRSEIANSLHADVSTTLSNINLLGEMAKIKADKDIDRSKEYIDQISAKSHNMIIAMDDILWSIDPENDSMEKTVLRMLEYADALRNRHEANIEISVDKKVQSLKLDMKTRHEFLLIFKDALRLMVQLAGGRQSLLQVDLFRHKLSLKFQDHTARLDSNAAEIDQAIEQIQERCELLNGESDIQYDKNGMAIVVLLPVK
ncbi:MAG: two-component regulator propeller domain-containing protein [Chitinophagaceae bacterium]